MVRTFSVRILAVGSHFSTADCQILQQDYGFSFSMVQIMAYGTSPNATLCQFLVSKNDVVAYHSLGGVHLSIEQIVLHILE